jgi:hypothetical protein
MGFGCCNPIFGRPYGHARTDTEKVQIRIEGIDLPGSHCGPSPDSPGGYHNIHVAVQRRSKREELLGLTPGDAPSATWTLEATPTATEAGTDLKGPYIQGPPGGRFIYLSWGVVGDDQAFALFRRAKLWLGAVPADVLDAAVRQGTLVGRLGLTDAKGWPRCAAVRPPVIDWSAG